MSDIVGKLFLKHWPSQNPLLVDEAEDVIRAVVNDLPLLCPYCDNSGVRAVPKGSGIDIGVDVDIEQCEFCYREPSSLFNQNKLNINER